MSESGQMREKPSFGSMVWTTVCGRRTESSKGGHEKGKDEKKPYRASVQRNRAAERDQKQEKEKLRVHAKQKSK